MRYIQKNITSKARLALENFIRLERDKAHYDNFKQSDGKGDVQKSLLEEQGYICAYCMCRIEMPPKIEHWVSREKSNQEGKPLETLDYTNLLAVCEGTTLKDGSKYEHCDQSRSKSNRILTINPTDIRTTGQLRFLKNGTIESDNSAITEDMTIETALNLNALFLRDTRRNVYESVKKLIDIKCKNKETSQAKKIIAGIINEWETKTKDKNGNLVYKEYCVIVRHFFKK